MDKPLISVIIPVYNSSNYIAECLKSVVNQKYTNLEIIIVNDGSDDEGKTLNEITPFLEDKRIVYLDKSHTGFAGAVNYGIKYMHGEFFSFLSANDLLDERSVDARYKYWCQLGSKKKNIIATNSSNIDEKGDRVFRFMNSSADIRDIGELIGSGINGSSILIHKDLLKDHKLPEKVVYNHERFLLAGLINEGAVVRYLNKKLSINRIREKQMSATKYAEIIKTFKKFEKLYIDPLIAEHKYKKLKNVCFGLAAHSTIFPFYTEYLDKYLRLLKEKKKLLPQDYAHLRRDYWVSRMIGRTRKTIRMSEPNNELKKLVYVCDYFNKDKKAFWDEFVANYGNVNFTYLLTSEGNDNQYVKCSRHMSKEDLDALFTDVDVVIYNSCSDENVESDIAYAKYLLVEGEHVSHRKTNKISLDKYFNKLHSNWKGMDAYLLANSYFANNDFEKNGFKGRTYRFTNFKNVKEFDVKQDPTRMLFKVTGLSWKNIKDGVFAFKFLKKHGKALTLEIVGKTKYQKKLISLLKWNQIYRNVKFRENPDYDKEIASCGIVMYNPGKDGVCDGSLQQMLYSRCIVFADTNSSDVLYVAHKHNCFMYRNRKQLRLKLKMFLDSHPEEIKSIRDNARKSVEETWNIKNGVLHLFELMTSIIRKEHKFNKYEYGPCSMHVNKHKKYMYEETNAQKIEKKGAKNMAIGSLFGYATVVLAVITGLILTPWIIDSLGEAAYGIYGLAYSLIGMFAIDVGLTATVNAYLSKLRAKNDINGIERFLSTIFKIYLIVDVAFIIIIGIIYIFIDKIYIAYTPEQIAQLKPVLLIVAGYTVVNFPSTTFAGALNSFEKFGFVKFSEFCQKLLYFVFTIVSISLGWGLIGLVSVNVASCLAAILMRFLYMRFYLGIHLRLFAKLDRATVRELFKFSGWAIAFTLCSKLIFNITPSILAIVSKDAADGTKTGATEGAIFSIITTIESYIAILGTTISTFFMAKIARTEKEDLEERRLHLQNLCEKVGKIQFVIISLIFFGWITVGQEFINLWMNYPANDPFSIGVYWGIIAICVSELINIPENVFEQMMFAEGQVKYLGINAIVKAVINLALSIWLSREYGAIGACIAIGCARVINVTMNTIAYNKKLDVSIGHYFKTIFIRGAIASIIALGFGIAMKLFLPVDNLKYKFFASGIMFVIVYAICTFFITFNKDERKYYGDKIKKFLNIKKKAPDEPISD